MKEGKVKVQIAYSDGTTIELEKSVSDQDLELMKEFFLDQDFESND